MATIEERLAEGSVDGKVSVDAATLGKLALALGVAADVVAGVTPEQSEALNADLDPKRVKKKPGSNNDYLAEHDVVRTANRIFGFGKWGTQVKWLEECCAGPMKNSRGEEGFYVSYRCCVTLTVAGCVPVDGVGYGDAFEKQWSAQATSHELAVKEAESDAIKRAFKKFGDQFGLILYAKADDKARIAEEKAIEAFNAPASEADVAELKRIAEVLDNPAILGAVVAEEQEHGHVRAGWMATALKKAQQLAAEGGAAKPAPAAQDAPQQVDKPAAEVQQGQNGSGAQDASEGAPGTGQSDGHAAAQQAVVGEPIPEGDRAANDDELNMLLQLAGRFGPPGTKKANDDIDAQRRKYGGKVPSAWVAEQMTQISGALKKVARDADAVPEPVTPQQQDALAEAFSS